MNFAYIILPTVHDVPAFLCLTKNVDVLSAKTIWYLLLAGYTWERSMLESNKKDSMP